MLNEQHHREMLAKIYIANENVKEQTTVNLMIWKEAIEKELERRENNARDNDDNIRRNDKEA